MSPVIVPPANGSIKSAYVLFTASVPTVGVANEVIF